MAHDPNSLLIERGTEALRESIERDTRRYEAGPPARALDGGGDDAPSNSGLLTQDSVALRFAREAADRMLFDHHRGRWYFWEKTRWGQDEVKRGFQYARLLTRLESGSSDAEEIKAARRATFAGGVERFAQSDPTFAVTSEIWDKDPFLLGTPGAIVDLRTEFRLSSGVGNAVGRPSLPAWAWVGWRMNFHAAAPTAFSALNAGLGLFRRARGCRCARRGRSAWPDGAAP